MGENNQHWSKKASSGLLLLVLIAIGARVVYGLLGPVVPVAVVGVVLYLVYRLIFARRGE